MSILENLSKPHLKSLLRDRSQSEINLEFYDSIDSTNEEAGRFARKKSKDPVVFISKEQSAGRGTKGCKWFSPRNMSLYASLLWYPEVSGSEEFKELLDLPMQAGEIMSDIIMPKLQDGCQLTVKPPNDILINDRKIAGILYESASSSEKLKYLILGFGLNLYSPQIEIPVEIQSTMGVLEDFLNPDIEPLDIFCDVLIAVFEGLVV